MSKEDIIALNPEAMIFVDGPKALENPNEIYNLEGYESWRVIPAIQNRNAVSTGVIPWWEDYGLEIPTVLMIEAKGVYPDVFSNTSVSEWYTEYHNDIYGISEEESIILAENQRLDWIYNEMF